MAKKAIYAVCAGLVTVDIIALLVIVSRTHHTAKKPLGLQLGASPTPTALQVGAVPSAISLPDVQFNIQPPPAGAVTVGSQSAMNTKMATACQDDRADVVLCPSPTPDSIQLGDVTDTINRGNGLNDTLAYIFTWANQPCGAMADRGTTQCTRLTIVNAVTGKYIEGFSYPTNPN